jgi:Tfp pilus assembly protein PilO
MDLKNIDFKNINFEDIKAKVLAIDKKTLIKIGIAAGSVIFFLIIYYAILNPIVNKKKIQLDDLNTKKEEIIKFNKEIKSIKSKIKKIRPKYENYSTLFHSKAEVEGLYQTLSEYASQNGLIISKISKGKPAAITKSSLTSKNKKKKKKKKKKKLTKEQAVKSIAYFKIPVSFEIRGNFLGYIKFKRQVSLSKKMLNFDNESIKVVKGDTTNAIVITGVLTIVGLPNEFY